MSSIQLVEQPVFYPGVALGEASEQGRIVDTMRESVGGRIYLHERIVHEGAACLGYTRPEEVAELKEELVRLRSEVKGLQTRLGHWRPIVEAVHAVAEEKLGQASHKKKDPARKELAEALSA